MAHVPTEAEPSPFPPPDDKKKKEKASKASSPMRFSRFSFGRKRDPGSSKSEKGHLSNPADPNVAWDKDCTGTPIPHDPAAPKQPLRKRFLNKLHSLNRELNKDHIFLATLPLRRRIKECKVRHLKSLDPPFPPLISGALPVPDDETYVVRKLNKGPRFIWALSEISLEEPFDARRWLFGTSFSLGAKAIGHLFLPRPGLGLLRLRDRTVVERKECRRRWRAFMLVQARKGKAVAVGGVEEVEVKKKSMKELEEERRKREWKEAERKAEENYIESLKWNWYRAHSSTPPPGKPGEDFNIVDPCPSCEKKGLLRCGGGVEVVVERRVAVKKRSDEKRLKVLVEKILNSLLGRSLPKTFDNRVLQLRLPPSPPTTTQLHPPPPDLPQQEQSADLLRSFRSVKNRGLRKHEPVQELTGEGNVIVPDSARTSGTSNRESPSPASSTPPTSPESVAVDVPETKEEGGTLGLVTEGS